MSLVRKHKTHDGHIVFLCGYIIENNCSKAMTFYIEIMQFIEMH